MNQNAVHLLKIYVPAGLLIIALAAGAIYRAVQGDPVALIGVTFGLALSGVVFIWARYKRMALFRESSPDSAIQFYHRRFNRTPNGIALAAYMSAYAATLYGQYDRAREELCAIRWTNLPPLYQGFETHIHALLALFQMRNVANAMDLALEAKNFCTVDLGLPGAKTSTEAFDALILSCRAIQGESSPQAVAKLDRAIQKLPGVAPAIPAWAMAVRLRAAGLPGEAAKYERVVDQLTPHCAPLHQFNYHLSISA
jgi:hypothetical protein